MKKQMTAERERREQVIQAEAKKRSQILEAEGINQSKILIAEAEKQEKILRAEGKAEKIRLTQNATAKGFDVVRDSLSAAKGTDGVIVVETLKAQVKVAKELAASKNSNDVNPYDTSVKAVITKKNLDLSNSKLLGHIVLHSGSDEESLYITTFFDADLEKDFLTKSIKIKIK